MGFRRIWWDLRGGWWDLRWEKSLENWEKEEWTIKKNGMKQKELEANHWHGGKSKYEKGGTKMAI